jgi:Mn2+/Fe2+ NRAMP family transporter
MPRLRSALAVITPGLLVAATGVGAGDLATGGIAGSKLGLAVLWVVALGAFIKFVLSEGLARWQLATGQTILEGAITKLGPLVSIVFLLYLLPWSFFTGAAMMSACGITMQAIAPLSDDAQTGKLVWAGVHSLVGVALVWVGGFRLFERIMGVCIAVMFVSVVTTAVLLRPDVGEVARGLFVPSIPDIHGGGLTWTIALMGGVGGTLTIICYAYWMREVGRTTPGSLRTCRIDLAVGYGATALFGMAMIIIASGVTIDGKGATLVIRLAEQLESALGTTGKWIFLIGVWAAVFTSLLGVWQAVPYVFADYVRAVRLAHFSSGRTTALSTVSHEVVNTRSWLYRGFLLALASVPFVQVLQPFATVQQYYAVFGAAFVPMLALVLLILNTPRKWVGDKLRNHFVTTMLLFLALALAAVAAYFEITGGTE